MIRAARTVTDEMLDEIVCIRAALEKSSRRPFSDDFELVGLLGEREFSERFHTQMELRQLPSGDGGIDFRVSGWTIDVKTSRKPFTLPVERGKVRASIYVLAQAFDYEAALLGWQWGLDVFLAPVGTLPKFPIVSHLIPRVELRAMHELELLLMEGHDGIAALSLERADQSGGAAYRARGDEHLQGPRRGQAAAAEPQHLSHR